MAGHLGLKGRYSCVEWCKTEATQQAALIAGRHVRLRDPKGPVTRAFHFQSIGPLEHWINGTMRSTALLFDYLAAIQIFDVIKM